MKRRFPFPPNPVGWFAVAHSDELPAAGVVPIHYFGEELVLFRTEEGRAAVLDAFCPHLGAHLGIGGTVDKETIRCPFHAWCFDTKGTCTEVPYAASLPDAKVRSWAVREHSGFIFVHYHPDGRPPAWDVPTLSEYGSEAWTPYTKCRWKIRTDLHEMVENAFDAAHFRYTHKLKSYPALKLTFDGPRFSVDAETKMETGFGVIDGTLNIQSFGFGFGLARFSGLIDTLLITTITPIDDDYVDARFTFTVKKLPDANATHTVGQGFIAELTNQVTADIRIWEAKAFLEQPILPQEDSPIASFRSWAQQFYP